jgi:O-6-methylguanine DNA methyltransferase
MIKLACGPNVLVRVAGSRVSLALNPFFACEIEHPLKEEILAWLDAYGHSKALPSPFLPGGSDFATKVLNSLSDIPWGITKTYGEVASLIGQPKAARAVGTACGKNRYPLFIPCHRILPHSGHLGHYTPDPQIKKELLRFEGVTFKS